jgi:hypothetical protein
MIYEYRMAGDWGVGRGEKLGFAQFFRIFLGLFPHSNFRDFFVLSHFLGSNSRFSHFRGPCLISERGNVKSRRDVVNLYFTAQREHRELSLRRKTF